MNDNIDPEMADDQGAASGQTKSKQVIPVLIFCLSVFFIGLGASIVYAGTWSAVMTAIIWILACFITGSFIGFLFGIPKILQSPQSPDKIKGQGNYRQLVNTNLTEISDWLTKIIVGLGLVKLTKIPPYIKSLAVTLADGLDKTDKGHNASSMAFAYGIVVCFFTVGFLFGYLATRLYLAAEFKKADQDEDVKTLINTAKAQIDNLETNQSVFASKLYASPASKLNVESELPLSDVPRDDGGTGTPPTINSPDKVEMLNNLELQARNYMNINAADYGERVRQKDIAAGEMSNYALNNGISKDDIIQLYQNKKNEGLVLTLATLITVQPEPEDADRLLSVSFDIQRLHVRYRVLNAIIKLVSLKLAKGQDKTKIWMLMEQYKKNADASLLNRIDALNGLLKTYQA